MRLSLRDGSPQADEGRPKQKERKIKNEKEKISVSINRLRKARYF